MVFKFLTSLDADDIFISYSRTDGSAYLNGLDTALSAKGFSCFTDRLGTDADPVPPMTLFRKVRLCKTLVLLASPGAFVRPDAIAQELSAFAAANGTARIVCISFDRDDDKAYWSANAPWYAHVEGKAREREAPDALRTGEPSPSIVEGVVEASNYMKSKDRLRRYRNQALAGLLGLLALGVSAAVFAGHELGRAREAMTEAGKQSAIAESRSLANRSQVLLRQRPEELLDSLSLAVSAMKKSLDAGAHTVEADSALRDNLALLPRLRSSENYTGPNDTFTAVALSPDALRFATLSTDDSLRIYDALAGVPFRDRKPVKTIACRCSAVALSSGLSRAAAITEEGVKLLDLNDNALTRVVEIKDRESASFGKIALSPGGRYLAVSLDEGEDVGRLSKLRVIDVTTGAAVKAFDGLNMLVEDIAFGPAGDLAIGGKFGGPQGSGRVMLWPLSSNAPEGGAEPDLTNASFMNPQIVAQPSEVSVVAPGPTSDSFAADGSVWKRLSGATRYSIVARLPYVRGFPSRASIEKIAFTREGRTLVLARTVEARDRNSNDFNQSVLEVWDLPGHQDLAHVFQGKEVTAVGFKPGEPSLVTMTGPPTADNPAHVFRVVDGEQVESLDFDSDAASGATIVSADGAFVAKISESAVIVHDLWNRRAFPVELSGGVNSNKVAAVSPDGTFLALPVLNQNRTGSLVVFRAGGDAYREWKRIAQPGDDLRNPVAMSISANGRRLAVLYAYAEGFVRIWNVEDGRDGSSPELESVKDIARMVLSPVGRFLVVTDLDNRTRLLDLTTSGSPTFRTLLEDSAIASVAFSADERYLALGTSDGAVQVFDTSRPEDRIATLADAGKITAIAFSDDSRYLATAGSNPHPYRIDEDESYPVRVWLLQPADLIVEAERRLAPFRSGPGLAASGRRD